MQQVTTVGSGSGHQRLIADRRNLQLDLIIFRYGKGAVSLSDSKGFAQLHVGNGSADDGLQGLGIKHCATYQSLCIS